MGVVLLPHGSGTLISNPFAHPQIRNQRSYRPRIPHARSPCGLSHTLLRFAVRGASSFCRHLHAPCRPHHQSPLEPSTQHHWRWNTISCSKHGSYRCEERHSRRRVGQFCRTICWKCIPRKINKKITDENRKSSPNDMTRIEEKLTCSFYILFVLILIRLNIYMYLITMMHGQRLKRFYICPDLRKQGPRNCQGPATLLALPSLPPVDFREPRGTARKPFHARSQLSSQRPQGFWASAPNTKSREQSWPSSTEPGVHVLSNPDRH